jgi:hypothetical protein
MSNKNKRQSPRVMMAQAAKTTEFNPDYSTTKQDLRRILVLVIVFISVLIVLSIFQNQLLAIFVK